MFLSSDPYSWESYRGEGYLVNPAMHNTYGYANNSPMKYVDPDGRLAQQISDSLNLGSLYSEQTQRDTQYLYDDNRLARAAMNNPDAAGGIIGLVSGLAYSTPVIISQVSIGVRLGNIQNLPMLSRVDNLTNKGFDAINKATNLSKSDAIKLVQNTGKSLIDNRVGNIGNINTIANIGDKVIRVTTNPNATKIISTGIISSATKVQQYISNGSMSSVSNITKVAQTITRTILNLFR
jgi:hypothetical protein